MTLRIAPRGADTVELDARPTPAQHLHAIAGRLRERFIDLGAYDAALADDFEALGRLAATLEGLGATNHRGH